MTDLPIDLDEHRGTIAKRVTAARLQSDAVRADQAGLRGRREELEALLQAAPAQTWEEAAVKVRYLIRLFAGTAEAQDPRHRDLIAAALADLDRLGDTGGAGS
ncbi:MAG: hypothetical protein RIB84_08680 [Sneathiellaceae bacterium]